MLSKQVKLDKLEMEVFHKIKKKPTILIMSYFKCFPKHKFQDRWSLDFLHY